MIKRDKNGLTEEEFLQAYKPGDYDRPSVTVDMVVYRLKENLSSLQLLLIRRKIIRILIAGHFLEDSLV